MTASKPVDTLGGLRPLTSALARAGALAGVCLALAACGGSDAPHTPQAISSTVAAQDALPAAPVLPGVASGAIPSAAPTPPPATAAATATATPSRAQRAAYQTDGHRLLDPCGEELVMRGVNKMAVYQDRAGQSFPEIARSGANTVRFMWFTQVPASEAVQTLQRAVDSQLVPVWELHDASGDWSRMPQVEAWWTSPATIEVLRRFENRVIVNIANEPGQSVSDDEVVTVHGRIIRTLRQAGLRMPMMVTASGYGRDVEQMLRVAPRLQAADPLRNVLFDWHVYDAGAHMHGRIEAAITQARNAGIPLVMGEFAGTAAGACGVEAPWRSVLSLGQRHRVGWMAWSWDDMNSDCQINGQSDFDMVGDGIHLSTLRAGWARAVVLDDPDGIRQTSQRTHWQVHGRCSG